MSNEKKFRLSERESEDDCAIALSKATIDVRASYAAKHRHCQAMAKENQSCWHEERGLQIALHLLENITPKEFGEIIARNNAERKPPPDKYAEGYNEMLTTEVMATLQRGSKAGVWKGHKQ